MPESWRRSSNSKCTNTKRWSSRYGGIEGRRTKCKFGACHGRAELDLHATTNRFSPCGPGSRAGYPSLWSLLRRHLRWALYRYCSCTSLMDQASCRRLQRVTDCFPPLVRSAAFQAEKRRLLKTWQSPLRPTVGYWDNTNASSSSWNHMVWTWDGGW